MFWIIIDKLDNINKTIQGSNCSSLTYCCDIHDDIIIIIIILFFF